MDNRVILSGTLSVDETFGGFCLYGINTDGETVHLACMGDGVDLFCVNQESMTVDPSYNPNDDHELAIAYHFEIED